MGDAHSPTLQRIHPAARVKKEHHTETVWCSRKDQIVRSS